MTAPAAPAPDLVVLDGFHALKHALRFGATVERAATSDPDGLDGLAAELAPDLRTRLRELVEVVDPAALRALAGERGTPADARSAQFPHTRVVALARRPRFDPAALLAPPRDGDARPLVLLEDPRHLGNVGAVVRVAAAADAAGVLTTGDRDPWDRAALRGAAGLHFALPVGRVELEAAIGAAPRRPLVALDPAGEPLRAAAQRLPPGAILAFGTERHGLGDALLAHADLRLRIEMRAGVSSLNLATAVSAVLFAPRLAR